MRKSMLRRIFSNTLVVRKVIPFSPRRAWTRRQTGTDADFEPPRSAESAIDRSSRNSLQGTDPESYYLTTYSQVPIAGT